MTLRGMFGGDVQHIQEQIDDLHKKHNRRSGRYPHGDCAGRRRDDHRVDELRDRRERLAAERAIEDVLADSFPASDPPSWNPGITRLALGGHLADRPSGHTPLTDAGPRWAGLSDVVDVSRPTSEGGTFLQGLVSLTGAAGIALLVPFVILLIGLPIALAVRGLLEVVGWVLGAAIR